MGAKRCDVLFQWAFAPTSVSFWSFLRAADAGDAAPGVHCGTKSFLPALWVFTPIHIGDGGRGLATKVSNAPFLLSFFFFFPGENAKRDVLFETGTSKGCRCSWVQHTGVMKQREKSPLLSLSAVELMIPEANLSTSHPISR